MTDYYKITVEMRLDDNSAVVIYTANITEFSIIPESFSFNLLRKDLVAVLGNRPQTGLYYTRDQHAEIDAVIAKLKSALSEFETYIYAEWAFEY